LTQNLYGVSLPHTMPSGWTLIHVPYESRAGFVAVGSTRLSPHAATSSTSHTLIMRATLHARDMV
jgi:hypothetical protein